MSRGGRLPCPRDSALRRAAFCGNLAALPSHLVPGGRSVRVFISANPEDTIAERNALREHVYPKLREFCRENYGLEFQVIDLYWGVETEEWDSPELQKTRMKLLEDCLKTSAGPCFVGLLGEKYGSIRIPGEVESSEFEMIIDAAVEAKLETRLLEEWYCRDENAVPPAYYLRPKSEMLKNYHNTMESSANSMNESKWQDIAEEIKRIFKTAVKLLYEKGKMKHSQAKRYLSSAIEDEFDFALGKQTPAFLKKCVCYIRKIANIERFVKIPEMEKYMDVTYTAGKFMRDPEALEKLIKLRDEFIPTIVASSNLRVYTSITHCDMKLGYSQDVENHYIEGLGKQFYEDMIDIIQATVQQNFDTETDLLYDEVLQHSSLCKTYSSFYEYRCEALNIVHKYILPSKVGHINPLIIYGGPCTGKTLLLGEVAKKAYMWLQEEMGPESDPVCGPKLLSRALGYITMSKSGLSEMELEDILALDNSVMDELNEIVRQKDFEISPNGKVGIISRGDENINVLDLQSGKLRVVHAPGIIWRQRLSRDGRYLVYICFRSEDDDDNGAVSSLTVMRLADALISYLSQAKAWKILIRRAALPDQPKSLR
ncbi:NACHT and WD repeat domain-containing protein 2 [Alligator mississippiensis]|uniref:NACHT and WD repeat domain-containing protein 2 n=1 Tax=Alligator mississippiensis TaxID=8496 RepID=A0A151P9W7_ALLMI|nr:NACHT and WD repeat domain-containing protein 2 [Alligator mississippiensis]